MSSFNTSQKTGKVIYLRDGRALGYAEYGAPAGKPVFFFHGWPGSRLQRPPRDSIACELGVRLITTDRPGYGLSDFKAGRRLLDWPDDVVELADALGIDRFAAIGLSGGGPHLLACAYKIPQRLTSATVVSGLGPLDQPGVTRGMNLPGRILLGAARSAPWWLIRFALGPAVWKVQRDPAGASKRLPRSMPQADKDVFARPDVQAMDHEDLIEAYRKGVDGVSWEAKVLAHPWGFRLEDIRMKIYLWQGEADRTVPVPMAKYMARTLPESHARFIADEGHMLMFNYWREILAVAVS